MKCKFYLSLKKIWYYHYSYSNTKCDQINKCINMYIILKFICDYPSDIFSLIFQLFNISCQKYRSVCS